MKAKFIDFLEICAAVFDIIWKIFLLPLIILTFLFGGCSKHNVNLKGVPSKIQVEVPPMEVKPIEVTPIEVKPIELTVHIVTELGKASDLCNERFGVNSELSNECFMAYLTYYKIDIGFDMSSIETYCDKTYPDNTDYAECLNDLQDLLSGLYNNNNGQNNENNGNKK